MIPLRLTALAAFAGLGLVTLPGMARAVIVTTNIHGTLECRTTSGSTTSINSKGVLQNRSSIAHVSVVCPIDRKYVGRTPEIQIALTDNSSMGAIACRAVVVSRRATVEALGAVGSSTAGSQWLTLAKPGSNYSTGSYQVRCTIPKRGSGDAPSTIGTILVREENGL